MAVNFNLAARSRADLVGEALVHHRNDSVTKSCCSGSCPTKPQMSQSCHQHTGDRAQS